MALKAFPSQELEPRNLSPEEIADPIQTIHQFFAYSHLPGIREKIWELLKTAVTGNFSSELSRRERSEMIYFIEQLQRLIEAAHLLHRKKRG